METALNILLMILVVAASLLCVYLIVTLNKLMIAITFLQNDVHELKEKVDPILLNVNTITSKAAKVTTEVEQLVDDIKDIGDGLRERFGGVFHSRKSDIGGPVGDWYNRVSAFVHGVSAFWTTLRNK